MNQELSYSQLKTVHKNTFLFSISILRCHKPFKHLNTMVGLMRLAVSWTSFLLMFTRRNEYVRKFQ